MLREQLLSFTGTAESARHQPWTSLKEKADSSDDTDRNSMTRQKEGYFDRKSSPGGPDVDRRVRTNTELDIMVHSSDLNLGKRTIYLIAYVIVRNAASRCDEQYRRTPDVSEDNVPSVSAPPVDSSAPSPIELTPPGSLSDARSISSASSFPSCPRTVNLRPAALGEPPSHRPETRAFEAIFLAILGQRHGVPLDVPRVSRRRPLSVRSGSPVH